jgi:retron-type reverse transcriptase
MKGYEEIYKFENLYAAHKAARRGKQGKREVVEFEMNLAANLCDLQKALEGRVWTPKGYSRFKVYDPKTRTIYAPHYADRVVQHSLCDNVLAPELDKRLIYDNAACRMGKGTHFSLNRLTGFLSEFYKKHKTDGYFLKIDIRKFFDNIDHEALKTKLARVFKEKDLSDVIYSIIDSYSSSKGKGLPLGNQTSQWFALYYLDGLDRMIKEQMQIKYYTRYMDDFVLIHESKDYLAECLKLLRQAASELGLEYNNKTQISSIKNGIRYLGFHIYLTDTGKIVKKVSVQTKKRYKRLLKKLRKDFADGQIDLDYIMPKIRSYAAHLKHGHTYRLRCSALSTAVFCRSTA